MSNLMIALLVAAGIAVVVSIRMYQERKRLREEREERERMNSTLNGIGRMSTRKGHPSPSATSSNYAAPIDPAHFPYPAAAVQSGAGMTVDPTPYNETPSTKNKELSKFEGEGGTFDGGGSSGDWHRDTSSLGTAGVSSDNDNASSGSSSPSTSSDSSSSSSDSGSSSSSSSSD